METVGAPADRTPFLGGLGIGRGATDLAAVVKVGNDGVVAPDDDTGANGKTVAAAGRVDMGAVHRGAVLPVAPGDRDRSVEHAVRAGAVAPPVADADGDHEQEAD